MIGTAPSLFPLRFRRVTLSAGLRPALAGAGATPKPQKRNAVLEAFPDISVISNPVRQLMGKPPETTLSPTGNEDLRPAVLQTA